MQKIAFAINTVTKLLCILFSSTFLRTGWFLHRVSSEISLLTGMRQNKRWYGKMMECTGKNVLKDKNVWHAKCVWNVFMNSNEELTFGLDNKSF